MVSFTPRPLYPQGKSPWYPLNRKLGGPQNRSGHGVQDKNLSPYRESNPDHPITSAYPVPTPTELSWLIGKHQVGDKHEHYKPVLHESIWAIFFRQYSFSRRFVLNTNCLKALHVVLKFHVSRADRPHLKCLCKAIINSSNDKKVIIIIIIIVVVVVVVVIVVVVTDGH
jgi:hypothetical protein